MLAHMSSPSSSEAVVRVLWVTLCVMKAKREAEGVLGRHPAPCHSLGIVVLTLLKELPWVLENLLWS